MKKLVCLLFVFKFIVGISQTKQEVIDYLDKVTIINNNYMNKHLNFIKNTYSHKSGVVNEFSNYIQLLEHNKTTIEELEKVQIMEWDENFLKSVIVAHNVVGENLENTKSQYERFFQINEFGYQESYNHLLITEKMNGYLNNLNDIIQFKLEKISSKYQISLNDYEKDDEIELLNERINYVNKISIIYLPVMIEYENLGNTFREKDNQLMINAIEKIEKKLIIAINRISEINPISNGNYFLSKVSELLSYIDNFVKENGTTWIESTKALIPNENATQSEVDKYNNFVDKLNRSLEFYNKANEKIENINNAQLSIMQI